MDRTVSAKKLASNAEQEFVTTDRLTGDMKYYPNILDVINDFEQPHYISLLKANSQNVLVSPHGHPSNTSFRYEEGALVATDCFLHFVHETHNGAESLVKSYESISYINIKESSPRCQINVHFGGRSPHWKLVEAKTAPDEMLNQTIKYVRNKSLEKSFFNKNLGQ